MPCFPWCFKQKKKVHPVDDAVDAAGRNTNTANPELTQVTAAVDISCCPWFWKWKRRKKVHPKVDDRESVSAAGRSANTANPDLTQVTAVIDIPCCPCVLMWKRRKKVHPTVDDGEAVSAAERSANTASPDLTQISATAVTESYTATTETQATTVVSGEITTEMPISDSSTVAEISTVVPETSSTMEVDKEISMATEETKEICVQELDQKLSSAILEKPAVVENLHGGVSPVCVRRMQREGNQPEEAKTHTLPETKIIKQRLKCRGLKNFGNSCYINASLQCLFSVENFCTQLSSQLSDWIDHPSAKLIRCFIKLWRMRETYDRKLKASLLKELIDAGASTNSAFTTMTQNDAHEFLFHCLSQMQEIGQTLGWAGGVSSECPVRANFSFKLKCTITCGGCKVQKYKEEEYNHLALALVPQGSVKDCLELFFSDEENIERRCELCGCSSSSCKWAFHTLPRVLVLQLKRFQVSVASTKKWRKKIHIDPELHLTLPVQSVPEESVHVKTTPTDHLVEKTLQEEDSKADEGAERNELGKSVHRYSLISVLNHVGPSIGCGHYISDCCSQSDLGWLSYDDRHVTMTTMEEIMERRQRRAYMLFYQKS